MMQKKKKGRLQKGIMVAVSALTVLASASTALAYQPMQSSDMSVGNAITKNADFCTFEMLFPIDPEHIDFSKGDSVFIYPDGIQETVKDKGSARALCTHSMVDGYFSVHEKTSSGGCKVTVYNAKRCKKCGYLANAVYNNTITYAKCPH